MADFPSISDLSRIFEDEVLAGNGKLTVDAARRDGADLNIIAFACVAMADEVVGQMIDVESGLYLDSAVGQKLDRWVFDRYGLVRKAAAPALGSVNFSTTVANAAPFTIPSGTVVGTASGIQFSTISATVFLAGITGPLVVPVRSLLAGLDQTAAIGEINSIGSGIPGQPADLAVTNSLATSGAADAETDTSLRNRARQFFVTARRGTLKAIEQGATAVPGVESAKAIEVYDTSGRPARLVQLIIADQYTDALALLDVNPPAYQAKSQQLAAAVFSSLDDVRAGGIYVQVIVGQVVLLPVTLNLKFVAGANIDLTATIARAVVSTYVSTLPAGTAFSVATALSFLKNVPGLFYTGQEIQSPEGDVIPKAVQVLRTSFNLVTAQAVQGSDPVVLTATANPDAFIRSP